MWSQGCPEITQVVSKFYKVSQGCVNAMLTQSCIQVFQSCVKVVTKLSQSWPNIVLSCVKVVLEVPTSCPLSQSYLKVVPKSSQNCIKVVPQLCPSCPKVPITHCACGAKWCQVVPMSWGCLVATIEWEVSILLTSCWESVHANI